MLPIHWQSVRTSATFNVQIKNSQDKDNAKQTLFYGQKQEGKINKHMYVNFARN